MSYEFMHTFFMTQKKINWNFLNKKNKKMCGVVSHSTASWSGSLQFIFSIEWEREEKILYGFCISILYAMFCFFFILRNKKSLPLTSRVDAKSTHFGLYVQWWSVKAAIKNAHKRALSIIMLLSIIIRTYQWHYSEQPCTI